MPRAQPFTTARPRSKPAFDLLSSSPQRSLDSGLLRGEGFRASIRLMLLDGEIRREIARPVGS